MQPIFLQSIAAIGAQDICNDQKILQLIAPENLKLTAVEPTYFKLINPVKLRRMSRIHKMSLYTAIDCMNKNEQPSMVDAVIIGTAKGSMLDTEKFIKDLDIYNEESMNPTPFIASTYNAVNGAIALTTQATVYHQTYVNRGSSFENALLDAQMYCNEHKEPMHVLVGGFEELTEEYYLLKNKLNYWKKSAENEVGCYPGEGACFAIFANQYLEQTIAIASIHSYLNFEKNKIDGNALFEKMIAASSINLAAIKLLIVGINEDVVDDSFYQQLLNNVTEDTGIIQFKNLFGEFETVGSFGIWLIWALHNNYDLPDAVWIKKPKENLKAQDQFLICNHYFNENYNVIHGFLT